MKIVNKIKYIVSRKNQKAVTILFIALAVTFTAAVAGAVTVSKAAIPEKRSSGAVSADAEKSENSVMVKSAQKPTERPTEKPTQAQKKCSFKLADKNIALKSSETYCVKLADGMKKEKLRLKWTSDNSNIAKVNKNGEITAVSKGTTVVSCVNTADDTKASITVCVTEPVFPKELSLDRKSYKMTSVGQLLKLNAKMTPVKGITEKKLVWKTDDESVAVVENGLVKSVGEGTAIITCVTENDITAQCEIYVENVVKAKEVYVDYEAYDFNGPQTESVLLTAWVYPENTTNKAVRWHSTDENVAMVDDLGNVTIVGDGECDVVCTTTDGTYLSSACKITSANTMAIVRHTPGERVYVPVNPVPADTVLEESLRYVGRIPYIWGGTDLCSGVDCSGFICSVYERFGVNLWGVRTDLYLAGVEVPCIEEAKAGDILCYPGHVAIYDGNGGRVHAYDEGYMVLRDTNIGGYYTIRRIIE